MQQISAAFLDLQVHADWRWITLGAPALANAAAGQYLALRCTHVGYDPLIREPMFIAATDPAAGTCSALVPHNHPAARFVATQARGTALDVLGPLGHGWTIEPTARTIALAGTAHQAAPLFALAYAATRRGLSVTLVLGADDRLDAPPPFLLPAAAEYNVVRGPDAAAAALALLDDALLRWADLVAVALPQTEWSNLAQRVRSVRLQWSRNFVQAAVLPPFACCVGVCGVCAVPMRQTHQLACVNGPVFDLRDLVR